jgi:hypothetical protein
MEVDFYLFFITIMLLVLLNDVENVLLKCIDSDNNAESGKVLRMLAAFPR